MWLACFFQMYVFQLCQVINFGSQSTTGASSADEYGDILDGRRGYADDSKARAINESDVIILKRKDTVALHSTVADGKSYRGQYTKALAEQIHSSDGNTDIYDMHKKAADKVTTNHIGQQTPKIESTATKSLKLPKNKCKYSIYHSTIVDIPEDCPVAITVEQV